MEGEFATSYLDDDERFSDLQFALAMYGASDRDGDERTLANECKYALRLLREGLGRRTCTGRPRIDHEKHLTGLDPLAFDRGRSFQHTADARANFDGIGGFELRRIFFCDRDRPIHEVNHGNRDWAGRRWGRLAARTQEKDSAAD